MKRFLIIPLFIFSLFAFASCDDAVEVCLIDGYCQASESIDGCPEDCDGVDVSYCGNDLCEIDFEDEATCPNDCELDPCGDGTCAADETWANCSADCDDDCNNDDVCDVDWEDDVSCPNDCVLDPCGDGTCAADETWLSCAADCDSDCNEDDVCDEGWEDIVTCPADCALSVCDDGDCALDEDLYSCPEDCAIEVCDDYAIWVEDLFCEDDGDTCVVNSNCEANLIAVSDDAATEDEVLLIQDCAALLAEDTGSCTEVIVDGINCGVELSETAEFICTTK